MVTPYIQSMEEYYLIIDSVNIDQRRNQFQKFLKILESMLFSIKVPIIGSNHHDDIMSNVWFWNAHMVHIVNLFRMKMVHTS